MLDSSTPEGRIVAAALKCAEARDWDKLTLSDIAQEAGVDLVTLADTFANKAAILTAFIRMVDREVLKTTRPRRAGDSARDALFEVVMARFDALMPHRKALQSIAAGRAADPTLIRPFIDSQMWMLEAAGVASDGIGGAVRALGLGSVYASVFRVWLDDDDPGMARTMAALDRRLRRGERTLQTVDGVWSGIASLAGAVRGGLQARTAPKYDDPSTETPRDPGHTGSPPPAPGA